MRETMKKSFHIDVFVNYRPEEKPTGFHDFLRLSVNGKTFFSSMCSGSPNGFHPRTKKPWHKHYGWVAPQTTSATLVLGHRKFGDCLLVGGGKQIVSINENPNHNGKKVISAVFIHRALGILNKLWRGSSSGTITIHHNGNLTEG